MQATRASFLTVTQSFNLNLACKPVAAAYGNVYLVGSVMDRRDYRDVDLRTILADDEFDAHFALRPVLDLVNTAVSTWLTERTGLPIDFQIQRMTDANREFLGPRSACGI